MSERPAPTLDDRPDLKIIAEMIPADARVLDIGCGLGGPACVVAGRGAHVVGTDLETPLVERAHRRAEAQGVADRTEFRVASAGPLAFPDGSFDGYLRLAPGENIVRVVATMAGGGELRETRSVYYERPERPTATDLREAEALRNDLRQRTVETELDALRARNDSLLREVAALSEDPVYRERLRRRMFRMTSTPEELILKPHP